MSQIGPGVDEVHDELLDRILSGFYPPGSRLPSCRTLARELGSNSSTVDRAVSRLAAAGRVRTYPRRGTFVADPGEPVTDAVLVVESRLEQLFLWAGRLGLRLDQLTAVVGSVLERIETMPRVALVECNERDLRHVQQLLQQELKVEVHPVLLSEATGRLLDEEFDAVVSPLFHLNDVGEVVTDPDAVVELHLTISPASLRQLVECRRAERILVVAPTRRGVQWMTAVVGQYYAGPLDAIQLGVDEVDLPTDAPVVVTNNAAAVPDAALAHAGRVITIEWEIDPRSLASLRAQIDRRLLERRRQRTVGPSPGRNIA